MKYFLADYQMKLILLCILILALILLSYPKEKFEEVPQLPQLSQLPQIPPTQSRRLPFVVPSVQPSSTLEKVENSLEQANKQNTINPFSTTQYNYNDWKASWITACNQYAPSQMKIDNQPAPEYQYNGEFDDVMSQKLVKDVRKQQGLFFAYGQCVENGNSGCNCPDSSFTYVEDMSTVIAGAESKPGCIQLKQEPYCYSMDGINYVPDFSRLGKL